MVSRRRARRIEALTERIIDESTRIAQLASEARSRVHANVRPVDAATLILIDGGGKAPKVLMGKRHESHRFMPGKFVFPGGRREKSDQKVPVHGALATPFAEALGRRSPGASLSLPRRLALAAIRETFEETGLVIGAPHADAARHAELALSPEWQAFLATGHLPDLSGLAFLARAITPPRRPKRFDTRFFVADAARVAHKIEDVVSADSELTELVWIGLSETADMPLPAITRVILADLELALKAGFPGKAMPVPFYFERRGQFQRELI